MGSEVARRSVAGGALAFAFAFAFASHVGCGARGPVAPPWAREAVAAPSAPSAPPTPDGGAKTSAAWEAMQRELAPLADYRSKLAFVGQPRPARLRPLLDAAAPPFPGAPFASVRAYTYRFDGGRLLLPSCVVAPDGALCAGLDAPGRALDAAQIQRLLAIVPELSLGRRPPKGGDAIKRPASHCVFDPHHAFVFFDAEGRPVGELALCLSCGQLAPRPKVAELGGDLFPEEIDALRGLCRELGLGGCFLGTREHDDAERAQPALAAAAPPPPPTPDRSLPVPGDRRLSAATDEDRRRLCLWYANEAAAAGANPRDLGEHGFRCPSGEEGTMARVDWASCVAAFPRCDATVDEVAACVKWRLQTSMCPDPKAPDPCAKVGACTWGVRRDARGR